MAKVETAELSDAVLAVLANAATGRGSAPGYLTAYQILNRLPEVLRQLLVDAYGESGRSAGQPFGAATRVAQVADSLGPRVAKAYLDTGGLQFAVQQDDEVAAGYPLCALFRIEQAT